jgi:hypothetical protein
MFLRSNKRRKDGKTHHYFSVVENRRVGSGRVVQRQVLFLGEINDSQQAAWRQTLEVFDEAEQWAATLSLFPEDREIPADALGGVQVKLAEMELRRPRAFGNYWLGCELWRQLGLESFWEARLGEGREEGPWAKVLELLVVGLAGDTLSWGKPGIASPRIRARRNHLFMGHLPGDSLELKRGRSVVAPARWTVKFRTQGRLRHSNPPYKQIAIHVSRLIRIPNRVP